MFLLKTHSYKMRLLTGITVFSALSFPILAFAQSSAPNSKAQSQAIDDEVIATGTLIQSSGDPVDIVNRIDLDSPILTGAIDPVSLLQGSTVTSGFQADGIVAGSVRLSSIGEKSVNLRGLGANRTLQLLNGRAIPTSASTGGARASDLITVPGVALRSIDVLKQGASSVYGSEAIAGVVNYQSVNDFEGAKLKLVTKAPFKSGGMETIGSAMIGKTSDRGSILLAGEYGYREALKYGDRDYLGCEKDARKDPTTGARTDVNANGVENCSAVNFGYLDSADLFTGGLAQLAYDPNGMAMGVPGFRDINGDFASLPGLEREDYSDVDYISQEDHFSLFSKGSYDFDALGGVTLGFEAGLSDRKNDRVSPRSVLNFGVDPFSASNPLPGTFVNARVPNVFHEETQSSKAQAKRVLLTAEGVLPYKDWQWSTSYQYGDSYTTNKAPFLSGSRTNQALNTVMTPDGLACIDPSNGCVPIDLRDPATLIGTGLSNAALQNYLVIDTENRTDLTRNEITAIVDGTLMEIPSGSVGFAAGINYRHDKGSVGSSANSTDTFQVPGLVANFEDTQETLGVFAEAQIPLLKDHALAYDSTLNLSARHTDYGKFSNETFKSSLKWAFTPAYTLRASAATSFRAPNLFEANGLSDIPASPTSGIFLDPCFQYGFNPELSSVIAANCAAQGLAPDFTPTGAVQLQSKNPDLKAENGRSFTVGMLLKPSFLPGELTVDYYNIAIKNGIQNFTADIPTTCYSSQNLSSVYCGTQFLGPRDANGNLTYIDARNKNVGREDVSGLDVEFKGQMGFPTFDLKYMVESNYLLSRDQQIVKGGQTDDLRGLIGFPEFTLNGKLELDYKDWLFTYAARYIGSVDQTNADRGYFTNDPIGRTLVTNIDAYDYHNMSIKYEFDDGIDLELGVENIFDKNPPVVSNFAVGSTSVFTAAGVPIGAGYNVRGRSLIAKVNYTF